MTKRDQILALAYEQFVKDGFNFRLSDVSGKLGIKKQSLYNYFESKNDLIVEMLNHHINMYYDYISEVLDRVEGDSATKSVKEFLKAIVNYNADASRSRARVWFSLYLNEPYMIPLLEKGTELEKMMIERFGLILDQGISEGVFKSNSSVENIFMFKVILRGLVDGIWFQENELTEDKISFIIDQYVRFLCAERQ